jgi:hypothetical protein
MHSLMLTEKTKANIQLNSIDSSSKEFSLEGIGEDHDDISDVSGPLDSSSVDTTAFDPLQPQLQPVVSPAASDIIHFFTEIESVNSTGAKEIQKVCNLCR